LSQCASRRSAHGFARLSGVLGPFSGYGNIRHHRGNVEAGLCVARERFPPPPPLAVIGDSIVKVILVHDEQPRPRLA
jgi:hypothetical protein